MLVTEKLCSIHQIEKQDNGRVIWEQMEKKFIRTYNSKGDLMQSKFHAISLNSKSYKDLKEIQKLIPVRLSVPQTIEWLIKVGQKQIQSEIKNTNVNDYNYSNSKRRKKITSNLLYHHQTIPFRLE